jgi:hypothetical protein
MRPPRGSPRSHPEFGYLDGVEFPEKIGRVGSPWTALCRSMFACRTCPFVNICSRGRSSSTAGLNPKFIMRALRESSSCAPYAIQICGIRAERGCGTMVAAVEPLPAPLSMRAPHAAAAGGGEASALVFPGRGPGIHAEALDHPAEKPGLSLDALEHGPERRLQGRLPSHSCGHPRPPALPRDCTAAPAGSLMQSNFGEHRPCGSLRSLREVKEQRDGSR